MRDEQRGHAGLVHADADPVAGDAGLSHLEQRTADPVAVADAHLVVGQALDGEVLAELPIREVLAAELSLPVAVRGQLIHERRPLLTSVTGEVGLSITIHVEAPHHAPPRD